MIKPRSLRAFLSDEGSSLQTMDGIFAFLLAMGEDEWTKVPRQRVDNWLLSHIGRMPQMPSLLEPFSTFLKTNFSLSEHQTAETLRAHLDLLTRAMVGALRCGPEYQRISTLRAMLYLYISLLRDIITRREGT